MIAETRTPPYPEAIFTAVRIAQNANPRTITPSTIMMPAPMAPTSSDEMFGSEERAGSEDTISSK
ncbi:MULTISPECIES: hypothetical protein [Streptomyces]|uniref:hypothetical protein n=1 Tax=Streptomyces TaxID=1883 RepID=UPI0006EB8397|nr:MULTISPECIES: hypothetical protein [Streptomyces]MCP3766583.1 hypothetical protein [Streptomyces sp. MAR25Y5]